MNAQDLMIDSFRMGGEPSDLNPYNVPGDFTSFDTTLTLATALLLLRKVNQGILRIANWQFPDGTNLRFRNLRKRKTWKIGIPRTITLDSGGQKTLVFTEAALPIVGSDFAFDYAGASVVVTSGLAIGKTALVDGAAYNGGQWTLSCSAFAAPYPTTGDSITVYWPYSPMYPVAAPSVLANSVNFNPVTQLSDIMRIRNVTAKTDLTPRERAELFTGNVGMAGSPTNYWVEGKRLYFNYVCETETVMEMLYYAQPTPLALYTDVPEIGAAFHDAVALWTARQLLLEQQDFNGAYAYKRDLQEMMQTLREQGTFETAEENQSLIVWG